MLAAPSAPRSGRKRRGIAYRYKPGFCMEGWWDPAQPALARRTR